MLERLERADRHAELLALLRVVERHVEDRLAGAHALGRRRGRCLVQHPLESGRGDASRACRAHGRRRRPRRRGSTRAEAAGGVERGDRLDPDIGRRAPRSAATASSASDPASRATTTISVDRPALEHELLHAVEADAVGGLGGGGGEARRGRCRGRARARARAPVTAPSATPPRKRACCSAVPSSRIGGHELGRRGEQGPGRDGPAHLLGHDRELDRRRGRGRRAPRGRSSAGQPSSTICCQSGSTDAPSSTTERTKVIGHSPASIVAHAVAELFLVFGEVEFHRDGTLPDGYVRQPRVGRGGARARRSTFSAAVRGRASTTDERLGQLVLREPVGRERPQLVEGRRAGAGPGGPRRRRRSRPSPGRAGWRPRPRRRRARSRAPPRPRRGTRCTRRGRTSPCDRPTRRSRPRSSTQPRSPVRTKPVGGERGPGALGVAPVAGHRGGGAQAHGADLAGGHGTVVVVEHGELARRGAAGRRSRPRPPRGRRARCRGRCRPRCTSSGWRAGRRSGPGPPRRARG